MKNALITGGSGFFGGVLIDYLLDKGWNCINIDILKSEKEHENLLNFKVDISKINEIRDCLSKQKVDIVFHCAALLAHGKINKDDLFKTNIEGTRNLALCAKEKGIKKFIYISSNCLWGNPLPYSVNEHEYPSPCEDYGVSKLGGEIVLNTFEDLNPIIFRVPTLIDEGRLGLLGILFDFIDSGKRIWVVGDGNNEYQFLYAKDLAKACFLASDYKKNGTFNLGADNVKSLRNVYEFVIKKGKSKSKVSKLPKALTLLAMRVTYKLGLSPLGPYHRRMIAESFKFDTSKAKLELGWSPTLTNEEILLKAFEYYKKNKKDILSRRNVSAHNTVTKAGIINLLKIIS